MNFYIQLALKIISTVDNGSLFCEMFKIDAKQVIGQTYMN